MCFSLAPSVIGGLYTRLRRSLDGCGGNRSSSSGRDMDGRRHEKKSGADRLG
ncbi:hypothetical protein FA13DRAFT_1738696 [Coprinellus micaceus]|uniref:Uncharacterized protein n=1 Tax=Coprinellus micaceus TaxID=71717 RepID=A0A4Y7ST89_COPMI|nr:hypothetical protein FA13DRAFT_1738696 [Coprinellus micaceus]